MHWVSRILPEENSTRVWPLPLHGCIDEPIPSLAEFAQNSKVSAPITNKRVMSAFQSCPQDMRIGVDTRRRVLRRASELYMCVEFVGAMESLDHKQKMPKVKQIEGI
jgi:hypothetical protein